MKLLIKKITLLAICTLIPISASAAVNVSSSNTGNCITDEVVDTIIAYGDDHVKFKLRNNRDLFNVYYHNNYVNGRAVFQMLLASILTGVHITADYNGYSCSSREIINVSIKR